MSAPVQNLSEWLSIATDGLASRPKDCIWLEIETDFADAVSAYQTSGISESDARARALADLGDPEAAKSRFRNTHLTEKDISQMKRHWKEYRRAFGSGIEFYISGVFIAGCLAWMFFTATGLQSKIIIACLFVVMSIVSAKIHLAVTGRKPLSSIRKLYALNLVGLACIAGGGLLIGTDWTFNCLVTFFFVRTFLRWLKLAKVRDFSEELGR